MKEPERRKELSTKQKEKSFSSINLKSFILVVALLTTILIAAGVLSYIIPQGSFSYDSDGKIIPGTYVQGTVKGIAIWRIITAPFRVFIGSDGLTIIMISLFLLVMSGVFNVMEKVNGVQVIIRKTVTKFSSKKSLVLCIATLAFMLFGSFFGMFEELVALLPIVIVLMLSMGFDTMTGLGVCMLAACFGFSSAITNPFSVGIASEIAGTTVFDGVWLRIIFFVIVYALVCGFILLHAKRIKKDPKKSLSFDVDREKLKNVSFEDGEIKNENKIFKSYSIFFVVLLVILIAVASIRAIAGYAIPILCLAFLVGGLWAGLIASEEKGKVWIWFVKGAGSMLPAILMVALASSVKLVLAESNVLDTIMNAAINYLSTKDKFTCILLIYFLVLFLQIFIGSASAKLMLIMPILATICPALGISPATLILTYCIADGFTDVILPTNPVLLIGLSIANVSYGKWLKWTWLLQIVVFAVTVLILLFAVYIGY